MSQDAVTEPDPATGLPKAVVYEQRRAVLTIETEGGREITLYSAPSRLHTDAATRPPEHRRSPRGSRVEGRPCLSLIHI